MSEVSNIREARSFIYKTVAGFFQGARVIWAEQINTKPKAPYVTIKVLNISNSFFPVESDSEHSQRFLKLHIEINLYTMGRKVSKDGSSSNYENTSLEDMHDFENYLQSENVQNEDVRNNATFEITTEPKDLSYLENVTQYRYRSLAEADVTFNEYTGGAYLASGMPEEQNSSGGGSKEIHEETISTIETEEIKEDFTNGTISEEQFS